MPIFKVIYGVEGFENDVISDVYDYHNAYVASKGEFKLNVDMNNQPFKNSFQRLKQKITRTHLTFLMEAL